MLKKTVNAVKAFQKDHGLYASGTVDQKLIDLIVETALGGTQEPEPTPAP
ncbi:MAG: peptidoglycan-binding protein [Lachnospiraceae bacterium]|nr:peptidoglycan-binding protein [Lachnospiraceae bacterium]